MRGLIIVGVACCVLAACGSETPAAPADAPAPEAVVMPENDDPTETPPAAVDCKDIQSVIAAAAEPVPFTSLRAGEAGPETFATSIAPAGAKQCQIGRIAGSGAMPTIHVVNCTLFTSGTADREKNGELARTAFDAARAQFTACLPADWTARDGTSGEAGANEAMIYESKADAQRAMTASSYTYPVQLRKQWVEEASAGKTPGWHVTLDFQKDAR
jgi:hypothetical protein